MCESLECQFCHKKFTRPCGLSIHELTCKDNPNRKQLENHKCNFPKPVSKCNWKCNICGSIFNTRRLLKQHRKESNHSISLKQRDTYTCTFCNKTWNTTKEGFTNHCKYCLSNPNKVKHPSHRVSEETRLKISYAASKKLSDNNIQPAFNKKACEYIDKLNEINNWNLQHAMNGGEVRIGPYYLDGYDETLNIAFEYDECRHNKPSIKEHDKLKQKFIIDKLNCKFYRYDENLNLLYEVNEKSLM